MSDYGALTREALAAARGALYAVLDGDFTAESIRSVIDATAIPQPERDDEITQLWRERDEARADVARLMEERDRAVKEAEEYGKMLDRAHNERDALHFKVERYRTALLEIAAAAVYRSYAGDRARKALNASVASEDGNGA